MTPNITTIIILVLLLILLVNYIYKMFNVVVVRVIMQALKIMWNPTSQTKK